MANARPSIEAGLKTLREAALNRRQASLNMLNQMIGKRYGKLVLLEIPPRDPEDRTQTTRLKLKWQCDCGAKPMRSLENVLKSHESFVACCDSCKKRIQKDRLRESGHRYAPLYGQEYIGTRRGQMTIVSVDRRNGIAQCDCGRSQKINMHPFLRRHDHCCFECKKARGMGEKPLKKVELTEAEQKQLDRILESRAKWFTKAAMAEVRTDAIRCIVRDRHPEMQYMLCHGGKDPLV